MKRRRNGVLSAEDRELWNRVRRSVTPLQGRSTLEDWLDDPGSAAGASIGPVLPKEQPAGPASGAAGLQGGKAPPPVSGGRMAPFLPPYVPPVSRPAMRQAATRLDEHTVRRLKKGRLDIDARIDLHGMTQTQAHAALSHFLRTAQASSSRIVLVITGKGRGGDGILRRAVPLWLAQPGFRDLVGGFRSAAATHGGDGAIYVRLRKPGRADGWGDEPG